MTERLYYADAYLREFEATVAQVRVEDGRVRIALDQSAFYPSAGGQPNDTGSIGGRRVIDVTAEDGVVWHLLEASAGEALGVGETVRGAIDWARRYDHMQQHSGQHLLSQVFERLYGWETVSVHIGAEENTLDLDTPALETAQIDAAEALAADKVYAALPIRTYFVDDAGLSTVPLRRPPKVTGSIRIVEIEQYDYSACGGTHCRTTAEAGPIKILRTERRRGIVRVSFLCGQRAFEDYRRKHRLLSEAAALFSSDAGAVPTSVERSLAQIKEGQRRIEELSGKLLAHDAHALLEASEPLAGGGRLVCALRDDLDAAALRTLATLLIETPGTIALLGSGQGGKLLLVFARGAEGPGHMGNLLQTVLLGVGGSGGGRPEFAQGGGVDAGLGAGVMEAAREQLSVTSHQ